MNVQNEVLKTAIKKMFNDRHFDICTIGDLLKMTGSIPNPDTFNKMNALHCVNYSDMSKELRDWLYRETLNMFAPNGFDKSLIDAVFDNDSNVQIIRLDETPKRNFWQKLLN